MKSENLAKIIHQNIGEAFSENQVNASSENLPEHLTLNNDVENDIESIRISELSPADDVESAENENYGPIDRSFK